MTLTMLLGQTINQPYLGKVILACIFMAPMALLMGLPFPAGLRFLSARSAAWIPWAWGVNGCFSVAGTVLSTILLVEGGFRMTMFVGGAAYALAAMSTIGWKDGPA
jgi:hypothetical protein